MENLPDEVVQMLLSFVGCRDLLAVACVNKQLNRIATDPSLHRTAANFSGCWHVRANIIIKYILRFSHCLELLNLEDCYQLDQWSLMKIIPGCKALKYLNILGCTFPVQSLQAVMQNCKHLQYLCWSVPKEFLSEALNRSRFVCRLPQLGKLKSLYLRLPTSSYAAHVQMDNFLDSCNPFIFNLKSLKIVQVERFCDTRTRNFVEQVTITRLHIELRGGCQAGLHVGLKQRTLFEDLTAGFVDILRNWTQETLLNRYTKSLYLSGFLVPLPVWSSWFLGVRQSEELLAGLSGLSEVDFTGGEPEIIAAVTHHKIQLKCLQYVNLSFCDGVTGKFVKILADTSPTIIILNLYCCVNCLDPIDGLKELANKCTMLKELNLGGICCHGNPVSPMLEVLSSLSSQLMSLGLPSCCVASTSAGKALNHFCSCQRTVKEFEFMDIRPHSVLTKTHTTARFANPASNRHCKDCPQLIPDIDCLTAISRWEQLKRLTLAGLDTPEPRGLDFFVEIAHNCRDLEFLSLAHLTGLSHPGAAETLNRALAKCYRLKQLRFEQTYFDVTQSFFESLHSATNLEAICVTSKCGSIAFSGLVPLMDKCLRLAVVQVFGDSPAPVETFKNMTAILKKRYESSRPGFSVCLLPYDSNTRDVYSQIFALTDQIPFVHLTRLTTFGSSVAIKD